MDGNSYRQSLFPSMSGPAPSPQTTSERSSGKEEVKSTSAFSPFGSSIGLGTLGSSPTPGVISSSFSSPNYFLSAAEEASLISQIIPQVEKDYNDFLAACKEPPNSKEIFESSTKIFEDFKKSGIPFLSKETIFGSQFVKRSDSLREAGISQFFSHSSSASFIQEFYIKASHPLDNMKSNLYVLYMETIFSSALFGKTTEDIVNLYKDFRSFCEFEKNPSSWNVCSNPFDALEAKQGKHRTTASLLRIAALVHEKSPQNLMEYLYENSRGSLTVEKGFNWLAINATIYTIRQISNKFSSLQNLLCSDEIEFLKQKLKVLPQMAFNSAEFRKINIPSTAVIDSDLQDLNVLYKPPNLQYITSNDFLKMAFSDIIKFCSYDMLNVDGDGNCFFRAIIKHHFPNIMADEEDALSLKLRIKLNDDESVGEFQEISLIEEDKTIPIEVPKEVENSQTRPKRRNSLEEFIEHDVNDAKTMKRSGVWADHVQVKKLTLFLDCTLKIVRYDDVNIFMEEDGSIHPGPDYIVGNGPTVIILHYTPTPGHYEILFPKNYSSSNDKPLESEIENLTKSVTEYLNESGKNPLSLKPSHFLKILFRIEDEVAKIRDVYETYMSNWDLRTVLEPELKERITAMYKNIEGFKNSIDMLGKGYFDLYFPNSKDKFELLLEDSLLSLFSDDFELQFGKLIRRGIGPLTRNCDKLHRVEPLSYQYPGSSSSPISSTWTNFSPVPTFQFSFDDSLSSQNSPSNTKKRSSLD